MNNLILTQISTFMFARLPASLTPALSGAKGRKNVGCSIVEPVLRWLKTLAFVNLSLKDGMFPQNYKDGERASGKEIRPSGDYRTRMCAQREDMRVRGQRYER